MAPADLIFHLRRRPFLPFRVVTSDSTVYEVRHPELVVVSLVTAIIGYPEPNQPHLMSRYDLVDLRHIIRLECIEQVAPDLPPSGNGNSQTAP
jgi:hypothetical protein